MQEEVKEFMVPDRKVGEAVGGKSVRACESCVRKRGLWYCAADDAFLCDTCDSSVHSANPLARRHERVRLKTGSSSPKELRDPPSWHEGFTKKARTPRRQKRRSSFPMHLVPEQELCSEDEESEDQLLYRVPVFEKTESDDQFRRENEGIILPSETGLAADVESLLGFDFDMEGLGIFDDDVAKEWYLRIKDEDDLGRETFELNFNCASPITFAGEEEDNKMRILNKSLLKLDYDRVMSAWDHKKSPWMSGERPELSTADWWTRCCLDTSGAMHAYGEMAVTRGAGGDGGREARVSRYRQKRRTRLFSKKIRYEVRKLNAEKRPRMKGRFVKRATIAASASLCLIN